MSTPRIPSFRTSARTVRLVFCPLALGLLLAVAAAAQPDAQDAQSAAGDPQSAAGSDSGSYGYLRLVEGSATLTQAGSGASSAAEVNQPIQAGDRLAVPSRGHVEVVLADHNIVRVDGDTQVAFTRLANSADRQDPSTELRLDEGNVQLIVAENSVGQELPTVLTPNASIYVQAYGSYRITADRGDYSELVVRRGTAQLVSDSGDSTVHAGEAAVADRQRNAGNNGIDLRQAGAFDALERWGRQLDDETRVAQSSYVDPSLSYEASSLDRYGHWIDVDNRQYWQPNNEDSGWSPYWEGRWDYTPSGQTWVSSEPWGWVPYHYGSWDYLPSYGWAWQPGYVYSPAWVYWYWGPSYAGWCPIGFYTGFYGRSFLSFNFGLYGWAGGDWGLFRHWNFVSHDHFFGRDWHRFGFGDRDFDGRRGFGRGGRGFDGRSGFDGRRAFPTGGLARGVITTSTRGLTPAVLRGNPGNAMHVLAQGPRAGGGRGNLPDVTPFIGRQPHLPANVAHAVAATGATVNGRLAGTPLAPHTLGMSRPSAIAAHGNLPGAGSRMGSNRFNGGGANGGANGSANGFRGRLPAAPYGRTPQAQQQHMGTFGTGRAPQGGGGAQAYPAHPAPAQPHGWTSRDNLTGGGNRANGALSSPGNRYQVTPRQSSPGSQEPRYQAPRGQAPQYQAPRNQGQSYQSPRYQAPRSQSTPQYQASPRYQQQTPRYQSPRSQSTPQYQASPRYQQSTPRYQSQPRYQQSAPRYQAPSRQSYQAPRASAPSQRRSSGGGRSSGANNNGGRNHRNG